MTLFTQPLCMLSFSFSDTTLLLSTLAMSINFFYLHLILAITTSCTCHPKLKIYLRYKNFAIFFIVLAFSVTFSINVSTFSKTRKLQLVLINKQISLIDMHLHLVVMLQKDLCAVRIFHFAKYKQSAFTNYSANQHSKLL